MKVKILMLITVLILAIAMLASCGGDGGNNNDNNGNKPSGNPTDEKFVYAEGSDLYVVRKDPLMTFDDMNVLVNGIKAKSGGLVTIIADTDEQKTHEIVLGETSRPISATAYALLDEMSLEDNHVGFAIYSDGQSVAIAYKDTVAGISAIEYFLTTHCTGSTLTLAKGYHYTADIDLIEYYAKLDKAAQDAAWAKLEAEVGKEFADAMKYLYSIYDSNVVVWLANLYDPGVGGFYFSNSGRDTPGYLPDIESTQQALGFIQSNGLSKEHWYNALPDWMLEQIGNFVYNLQDEDGYFYHPQWGKNITINRRGRDYDRGLGILNSLGIKPKYKTANENISGGTASTLTAPLGRSAASAVSAVVPAAAENTEHLKSPEAFRAYLEGLKIYNNSYSPGNQLAAQSSQIKAAGLMDDLAAYLAEIQNPENGLWDDDSDYLAVNGLLKLSGCFLEGGMVFPNAEKAARAAMAAITSDEKMDAVTDLYNTWYAFDNIINNLRHFGEDERADALIAELREGAVEGIIVSADKIKAFKKPDGSFSYGPQYSSTTSQGAKVAVPNSVEGDVNATVISYNGIYGHIFDALELTKYKVPLFGHAEYLTFVSILEDLTPVEKQTVLPEPVFIDFEDETVGSNEASGVDLSSWASTGKPTIVTDPRGGKCLEMQSAGDGGDYVQFKENISGLPASCYVFEADFCVNDAKPKEYFAQITMYNCYMFTLTADAEGKNVVLEDKSSTKWTTCFTNDLGVKIPFGQWFNVRVEYYVGNHDTVRIKFYVDDALVAITDNYFDASGAKLTGNGTPGESYTMTRIYGMASSAFTLLIDNAACYKTATPYLHEEITVEGGVDVDKNGKVERPTNDENGAAILTFEGSETDNIPITAIPNLVSADSAVTVETVERDGKSTKVLALDTNPGGNDRVLFSTMAQAQGYNCVAFQADVLFKDFTYVDNTVFQLFMSDAFMMSVIISKDGVITLENNSSPSWKTSKTYDLGTAGNVGEWFNLRVEFYPGDAEDIRFYVYLNNELICVTDNYRGNFKESPEAPKTDASDFSFYAIGAADGVVLLDNVTMTKIVKDCPDLPITTTELKP